MPMLMVNGAAAPAPSSMKVEILDVSSGIRRSADGSAVADRSAVKRRLKLAWKRMDGEALAALLQATAGQSFFEAAYPDPWAGGMRTIQCYCGDRAAGILRMEGGKPIWTDVEMIWTER